MMIEVALQPTMTPGPVARPDHLAKDAASPLRVPLTADRDASQAAPFDHFGALTTDRLGSPVQQIGP